MGFTWNVRKKRERKENEDKLKDRLKNEVARRVKAEIVIKKLQEEKYHDEKRIRELVAALEMEKTKEGLCEEENYLHRQRISQDIDAFRSFIEKYVPYLSKTRKRNNNLKQK